jgi:hypothetical protein
MNVSPQSIRPPASETKRQAVVIVHGMGEQRPMDTIRGFVGAVWSSDLSRTEGMRERVRKPDPDGTGEINKSWVHPDSRARSYELRRITTPHDIKGLRTEFYELYWSDITQGTTVQRLVAWVKGLLLRKWSDVPADARPLYIAAWAVTAIIATLLVVPNLIEWFGLGKVLFPGWVWSIAAVFVGWLVSQFLVPYFGDVAIYVRSEPDTIAKRTEVRERGLALLRGLNDDPTYDRIVVAAHSLGTIVAYDILQLLWAERAPSGRNRRTEPELLKAFRAVGKKALPIDSTERAKVTMDAAQLDEYRLLQWQLYRQLRTAPSDKLGSWKVSDFVTFGSPLTHAEFLVTHNAADFAKAVDERLLSTCPPVSEGKSPNILYPSRSPRYPHHAAVFSATRWTNIHDKGNGWLTGDPISGPLVENFGPGILNIQVSLSWALGRIFTHTNYWSTAAQGWEVLPSGERGPRSHLDVLRDAVDLGRTSDPLPPAPKPAVRRRMKPAGSTV